MTDLRFFEGFSWAVPTAFAGALAAYRFEQGDVLHRDRGAYRGDAPGSLEATSLQVLAPPRSARAALADAEGDRRRANFESEVTLALVDLETGRRRELETTQGRLLMTLWRGDTTWIEGDAEAPAVPLGARELASSLDRAEAAFATALGLEDEPGSLFLFVVDLASDASRVKSEAIREALAPLGAVGWRDLGPVALALDAAEAYHPALIVRGAGLPGVDVERVTEALRGALYGGRASTAAESDDGDEAGEGASVSDRFSVARHGLLVDTGAAPEAESD